MPTLNTRKAVFEMIASGDPMSVCKAISARSKIEKRRQKRFNQKTELYFNAKDKPCADCGIKYPQYVMDLDHVPEKGEKLFQPSKYKGYGIKTIKAEFAKCDAVCSNCHRERTHSRGYARTYPVKDKKTG